MSIETPAPPPPARSARVRTALLVLAVALLFALLEAAQGRFQYAHIGDREFWPEGLARSLPSWLILAAFYPLVAHLARRHPVDGRHWRAALPLHLVAATACVLARQAGAAWVSSARQGGTPTFHDEFLRFITFYTVIDYFVYGALAAALQIVHQQGELRRRAEIEARLRADLAEARLAALRHQLNPHFLFNTLNSISALALTGDRDTLVRAVDALSDLLRVALEEAPRATGSLAREMAFIDRYAEIQAIRFGGRLALRREIEPAAQGAEVPTLLLQPLVENAMTHGAGASAAPGWVAVRARREGDRLLLEVEDSGPGFPASGAAAAAGADAGATAEAAAPGTDVGAGAGAAKIGAADIGAADTAGAARPGPGAGVGLANTRARLRHLYGDAQSLECGRGAAGGARVTVRLPWRQAADPAAAGAA